MDALVLLTHASHAYQWFINTRHSVLYRQMLVLNGSPMALLSSLQTHNVTAEDSGLR